MNQRYDRTANLEPTLTKLSSRVQARLYYLAGGVAIVCILILVVLACLPR